MNKGNSSRKRYFDKFGMMYSKYSNQKGIFGVKYFASVSEYYFNDELININTSVGLNIGKFKSQLSRRAEIELVFYTKDVLMFTDKLFTLINGNVEYIEYSKKSTKRINYNDVVEPVDGIIGINKISDNLYKLGVFYRNQINEISDSFVIDIDKYDLIELYNLFRAFIQNSYTITTSLGLKYQNIDFNNIVAPEQSISNITVESTSNFTPDEEEFLEENSNLNICVPSLDSIKTESINEDTVIEESRDDEKQNDHCEEEYIPHNDTKEETTNSSDFLNEIKEIFTDMTDLDENESDIDVEIFDTLSNISNCSYSINNKRVPYFTNISDELLSNFFDKLKSIIENINYYGLNSTVIKPAMKILLMNIPIKQFVIDNNLVSKGLYDLLQSLFIINRIQSDTPMFGKYNQDLIKERLLEALDYHESFVNNKNEELYTEHLKKVC